MKTFFSSPASLGFLLLLPMAPAHAQAPDHGALPGQSTGAPEIVVHVDPVDRMQSQLNKQLELLKTMAEMTKLVQQLHSFGDAGLQLLREDLPIEERIRAAVKAYVPPPEPARPDMVVPPSDGYDNQRIEQLELEIAALRMDMENGLFQVMNPELSRPLVTGPEPEPAVDFLPDWSLAGNHVHYFQLPDPNTGTDGHVALAVADQKAELGLMDTVLLAGKRITLREMIERHGRVWLTFLQDGEPVRIDF